MLYNSAWLHSAALNGERERGQYSSIFLTPCSLKRGAITLLLHARDIFFALIKVCKYIKISCHSKNGLEETQNTFFSTVASLFLVTVNSKTLKYEPYIHLSSKTSDSVFWQQSLCFYNHLILLLTYKFSFSSDLTSDFTAP